MKLRVRQIIYIFFAIAAFVLLIVVVTNSQSPESLMAPPSASGDYKDILDAIEKKQSEGIILKAPNEGDNTTAITFADLNGDKENDAIAFYRIKNDDTSAIYMSVILKEDSKWLAGDPVKGKGNDVLEFSYGDLNYDTVPEIIVGWNMFDSKDNNTLCVYTLSFEQKQPAVAQAESLIYTEMFVADICGEAKKEILLVKNNYYDASTPATASLYEFEDGKLKLIDDTQMIASVQEYKKIQIQKVGNKSVFYLDGIIEKQNMITEILYWEEDGRQLVNPIAQEEDGIPTYRHGTVCSTDINEDGILEIPFMLESEEDYIPLTAWRRFELDGFTTIRQGVCSDELIFIFSDNWYGNVAVKQSGNIWEFYDVRESEPEKLFELLVCEISDLSQLSKEYVDKEFVKVKIDYGTVYAVNFNSSADSSLALSKNEIKDAIINIR